MRGRVGVLTSVLVLLIASGPLPAGAVGDGDVLVFVVNSPATESPWSGAIAVTDNTYWLIGDHSAKLLTPDADPEQSVQAVVSGGVTSIYKNEQFQDDIGGAEPGTDFSQIWYHFADGFNYCYPFCPGVNEYSWQFYAGYAEAPGLELGYQYVKITFEVWECNPATHVEFIPQGGQIIFAHQSVPDIESWAPLLYGSYGDDQGARILIETEPVNDLPGWSAPPYYVTLLDFPPWHCGAHPGPG